MGTREATKAKRRSLAELLYRQPAGLKKHPRFMNLVALLNASSALREVRLEPRAYRLLAAPRLKAENLPHYFRTYHLPPHEFFRLYVELKWAHLEAKEARKAARAASIALIMRSIASEQRAMIDWLRECEARANPRTPLWKERFEPRSKKRAEELAGLAGEAWREAFAAHLSLLRARYPSLALPSDARMLDYWALGCLPHPRTMSPPDGARLRAAWREASKRSHPDGGGSPERFRLIDEARRRLGL